jgi:hypothetical protein
MSVPDNGTWQRRMTMMKRFALSLAIATALATGAVANAIAAGPADSQDSSVRVVVKYTGKGQVDETHRVWLWLFDTPDIGPGSMPIAELSIGKNGDTVTFESVAAAKVWIAAAYDEHGTMSGSAPPPSGTPVGIYASSTGAPEGVKPGDKPAILTFDDSFRMP